jgi:integrase
MTSPSLLEPSFADALGAIAASDLAPAFKRHWACSIRMIAKALDRPPETIPARWTAVRPPIRWLHHAMSGNREKTLQNHKANARRALLWFAGEHDVPGRGVPLAPEWRSLRQAISDLGRRNRLAGLMRYCSGKEVDPGQVTEAVIDAYMAYRAATASVDDDATARRRIVRAWNACLGIKGWRTLQLLEPPIKAATGPTWEDFPPGLRTDIEAYLAGMSRPRRSATGKRIRPCKPSTIRTRRAELIAITKMAARIVPLESITGLRVFLSPELVEQIVEAYWAQDGEHPSTFTMNLGWRLKSIAGEIGGVEAAELERLDEIRAQLETYRQKGLVPKNLKLIRQVMNRDVWSSVVSLPWGLMRRARQLAEHAPLKAAVTAQLAVAIAILSVAPIRMGNLGRIRLGENLIKPGGPSSPYWLVFPDYDVKNDVPLEFVLDVDRTRLIDEYIHEFRPAALRRFNEPWLFPGESGGHKRLTVVSTQISRCIAAATGIQMTAHQFRHAAAAILLKHRPGEYELVRRLLGHKSIETTRNSYVGLETTQATEIYGRIIRDQLGFEPEDA